MIEAASTIAERWAWAEVDLAAIAHNVGIMRTVVAPADVWAVVKADAYGHGAVPVARAALEAGAAGLCVALVAEAAQLRAAHVDAPILVLSQQPTGQLAQLVDRDLIPTVYSVEYVDALAAVAPPGYPVHVKIDTGMQRVGAAPDDAAAIARHVVDRGLTLAGVFTHLACADEPAEDANLQQLDAFDGVLVQLDRAGLGPGLVHAANSAGAVALPVSRRSFVRAGIALYGVSPGPGVDHLVGDLEPAMSLRARVSLVKSVRAGSHVSYGWRHRFDADTSVATLPIGYADGVPRRLGTLPGRGGADVLIGGRRCPIVGVVTMDQIVVDVGVHVGERCVAVGDEAVLLGTQGNETIRAEDWADRLGTIAYEVVCGISARVPRIYRTTS